MADEHLTAEEADEIEQQMKKDAAQRRASSGLIRVRVEYGNGIKANTDVRGSMGSPPGEVEFRGTRFTRLKGQKENGLPLYKEAGT